MLTIVKKKQFTNSQRYSQIALSFDGLVSLNVKGDTQICCSDQTLSVCPSHHNR